MAQPSQPVTREPRASKSRLISSSLVSTLGQVLYIPVGILLTRFVLDRIGLQSFGIWAALTTALSYGGLLELGITVPLIKYTSEALALGRDREVNALLSTAMVCYAAAGALFVLIMGLPSSWVLTHVFHTNPHDAALRGFYLATLVGFAVQLTFSPLQSLLAGLQRVDIDAKIRMGYSFASAAGTVLLLSLGLGLFGLVLNWLVMIAAIVVANWIVCKRLFSPLALNPLLFRLDLLKKIFGFGLKVQVTNVMIVLNDQVDRTLIAFALGPVLLGFYALAARVATATRALSFAFMSGLLPAVSDLVAIGDTRRVRDLYLRASRYQAIMVFPLLCGIVALAQPLVTLWLGHGFSRVAITLVIVLLSYLVWLPAQATTHTLNGVGHPEILMKGDLMFLAIHVPLSAFLLWRFGYYGTVVGTATALVSTRLYVLWAGNRELRVPLRHVVRFSYLQPGLGVGLALAAVLAMQAVVPMQPLLTVVVGGVVFAGIYGGYVALFGLDQYDRTLIRSQIAPILTRLLGRPRPGTSEP